MKAAQGWLLKPKGIGPDLIQLSVALRVLAANAVEGRGTHIKSPASNAMPKKDV